MMPLNSTTPPGPTTLASSDRSAQGSPAGSAHPRDGQLTTAAQTKASSSAGETAAPHPAGGRAISIPKLKTGLPLRKRPQEVRRIAIEIFPAADSWVLFYREILGVDGVARKLFKSVEEIRHWESSEEFFEVQEMLTALRSNDSGKGESVEPQRMITVRLPTSVHESLKSEADEHQTSMNKLCLSKLMMSIGDRFVPVESGRIRGRRPGPQGKRPAVVERGADEPQA